MPVVIIILSLAVIGAIISYPQISKRLEKKQKAFELKEREDKIKGYLADPRVKPKIKERIEDYFDRKILIDVGKAEANQAADILETEEIRELIGGEFQLQELTEVLRSNQKAREQDVKLLEEVKLLQERN